MLEINKSVAVITGGARVIGLALAKYWAERGGKVVLGDIFCLKTWSGQWQRSKEMRCPEAPKAPKRARCQLWWAERKLT